MRSRSLTRWFGKTAFLLLGAFAVVSPAGCSSSSGSGSGGSSTCSSGPGTCKNGDSSTCRCGTACERVCETCDYYCERNCSSDSECAGLTDSSGNALTCSACPEGVCNAGFSACE
ncbi:MAG TPA: hypothetical protein VIY73_19820 [Polyangiaceae bacterium]